MSVTFSSNAGHEVCVVDLSIVDVIQSIFNVICNNVNVLGHGKMSTLVTAKWTNW